MALHQLKDEDHNFYRLSTLSYKHSSIVLTEILKHYCISRTQTFEQFLNHNKHELFHKRSKSTNCCMCNDPVKKVILDSQWDSLYKPVKVAGPHSRHHPSTCPESFIAITSVKPEICDVSLASSLILNIRELTEHTFDQFTQKSPNGFEEFLRDHQHILFHCKEKQKCCQCTVDPPGKTSLTSNEWDSLYVLGAVAPCPNRVCSCKFVPIPGISVSTLSYSNSTLISKLGQMVGPIAEIRSIRNAALIHSHNGTLDTPTFEAMWKQLTHGLLDLLNIVPDIYFQSEQRSQIETLKTCSIDGAMPVDFFKNVQAWTTDPKEISQERKSQLEGIIQKYFNDKGENDRTLFSLEQKMKQQEDNTRAGNKQEEIGTSERNAQINKQKTYKKNVDSNIQTSRGFLEQDTKLKKTSSQIQECEVSIDSQMDEQVATIQKQIGEYTELTTPIHEQNTKIQDLQMQSKEIIPKNIRVIDFYK